MGIFFGPLNWGFSGNFLNLPDEMIRMPSAPRLLRFLKKLHARWLAARDILCVIWSFLGALRGPRALRLGCFDKSAIGERECRDRDGPVH